jgi:bacillithiol system protein YtxJ
LPVIIFKYSSRCSISGLVLDRLERNWKQSEVVVKCYFLDLIRYRNVSDLVALRFDVPHESPQILVIVNGKSVHDASHYAIECRQIAIAAAGTPAGAY